MTVIKVTMSETGKRILEEWGLFDRLDVYAEAFADMLCTYIQQLA